MAVLILNATYEPLGVISTRRAVMLLLNGRAQVVATDPEGEVLRTASGDAVQVPRVVALTSFVRVPHRRVPLTRTTLFARDDYRCQVTGCEARATTVDHVIPRSRGGQHVWENVVAMCHAHNAKKDDKLLSELNWTLRRPPAAPKMGFVVPESKIHPSWVEWLPYTQATSLSA